MMAWNLSDSSFGTEYIELETPSYHGNRTKSERGTHLQNSRHDLKIFLKLKQFKEESKFCDVEIKVRDNIFQAHKVVLAAQSPYFASMLDPQIKGIRDCIKVDHLEPNTFLEFLDFLYMGDILPNENNIVDLLGLARQFQVDSLTSVCDNFIVKTLNVSNFVTKLLTSHKFELKGAAEEIIKFGRQNFSTIVKQQEFLCMSPARFYKLLEILKLGPSDVEIKLGLISHWVGYNTEEREKLVLHLLSSIDWTMTPTDVIRFITESENLFTASEFCLFQLMHRLYLTFQQLGTYFNTYESLHQVYKDVVDADFRKVMSESEKLDHLINFKVTFDNQSSLKTTSDKDTLTLKDACLNTDIDSTYFNELLSPNKDTSSGTKNIPICVKEELSAPDVEKENTVCEKVDRLEHNNRIVEVDIEELNQIETVEETEKDQKFSRRKGRPKKHRKTDDKVDVEKSDVKKMKPEKKNKSKNAVNGRSDKGTLKIKIKPLQSDPTVSSDGVKTVKVKIEENENKTENNDTDHYMSDLEQHCGKDQHVSDGVTEIPSKDTLVDTRSKLSQKKANLKGANRSIHRRKQMKDKIKKGRKPDTRPSRMKNRPFIKCSEDGCDYQTKNEKFMKRHVEMVHTLKVMLTCKHCDFSASLMRDLCQHAKQHYPDGPPYRCREEGCNFKGIRMGLLIRHQMEHTDERPYSCEICHKAFRTENQLSCHKKLHEGRQFVCDVCNKRFTTKGGMQTHRAIHFDNKPYLCDWCGFSTKHQSHLISHRKLHTGDLLKCTFENCSFVTNKKGYMTHHMNAHFNIRNHVCQVCGKSFVVRSKLIRHEKIHLEEKLYKCKSCDYQTSRTDRMKLHIQSHGAHLRRKTGMKIPKVQFDEDFDYTQMYEKVEPSSSSFYSKSLAEDVKSDNSQDNLSTSIMDNVTVSLSTVTDPIVSSLSTAPGQVGFGQGTYRQLDLLSVAAAGLEQYAKMQGAGFQQSFDQHPSAFEHI